MSRREFLATSGAVGATLLFPTLVIGERAREVRAIKVS
jgi:hypothetical protein